MTAFTAWRALVSQPGRVLPAFARACTARSVYELPRHAWTPLRRGLASLVEVPIPEMGDSISEGTILSLLKKPGEYVGAEEGVAEVRRRNGNMSARAGHGLSLALCARNRRARSSPACHGSHGRWRQTR